MQFVVIRLGKDSVRDIQRLDAASARSEVPFSFNFTCTQVEEGIEPGDYAIVWLGSDNNKGQPTTWKQGIRAIGRIASLDRHGGFNDPNDILIEIVAVFPYSVDQFDYLENSATYYKYFSKYPVIGVRSSRNNALQKVNEGDRQNSSALLTSSTILCPEVRDQISENAPELEPLLSFVPVGEAQNSTQAPAKVRDDDDVWAWISDEIFRKHERNFLFLGSPGTGKTWYAQEIAKKLVENNPDRQLFIQFHPSFSYDDFVEGYTPKLSKGGANVEYELKEKHFLSICNKAKSDGSNLYVIVIDELTRGDPSRIFGELLTYLEVEHRSKEFSLAYSGRKIFVPENLVLISTANPYDRSVGELDDALVRRFAMREFFPDPGLLRDRLRSNGAADAFIDRTMHVFDLINERSTSGFGHSHFWNVRNEDDFQALWRSRILFLLKREFQFDDAGLKDLIDEVDKVFPPLENVSPAVDDLPSTAFTEEARGVDE